MRYNYYNPRYQNYQGRRIADRIGFGAFAVPFALGFLTGPLFVRPNSYYPYNSSYYPYNYNTNYYYYPSF